MKAFVRAGLAAGTMLVGLAPALHAQAGGASCGCNVPSGHQVSVPGVNITPPSITVNAPTISISAPNIEVQAGSVSTASASSTASSSASGTATSSGYALTNAIAASNVYSFGGGGGGFSGGEGGGSSVIPNLVVEGVEAPAAQRVCAEMRSIAKVMAVQAVCLDDKDIPHPASQVMPDREVLPVYEGEVFRCIAGTHMQYTLAAYEGAADFSHGQTISCLKGEALYHSAAGQLACRAQKPARDCNERSLLRRYGAGIKVVKMMAAQQCVAWRGESVAAGPSAPESMVLDGGVGH